MPAVFEKRCIDPQLIKGSSEFDCDKRISWFLSKRRPFLWKSPIRTTEHPPA